MKRVIPEANAKIAVAISRIVSQFVRRLGVGEGATLPGRILLRLYPQAMVELSRYLPVVLISGTNAKTTTTALAKEALSGSFEVVSNVTGANMEGGVAFALAEGGVRPDGRSLGIFEVDEAYLPIIGSQLETKVVALLNLSRDQLDRVSETRMTSGKWRAFLKEHPHVKVVANCDDPLIVFAAEGSASVLWVSAGLNFVLDARSCPVCGEEIEFATGQWRCSCGFKRPQADIEVNGKMIAIRDNKIEMELALPGRCNVANSAIVLGICDLLGVDLISAARRMSYVSEVAGRYRRVAVNGHQVRMLLSKNPAGWLEVFDMVGEDPSVVVAINAQVADGRDPSWLWDVPFELLRGKEVFASGERAYDLSVCLHYADIPHVVLKDSLDALRSCSNRDVSFVGNYTSFQELRKRLSGGGNPLINGIRKLGNRVLK